MSSPTTSILPEIAIARLSCEQEADLNKWYDQLGEKWLTAINDSTSEESQQLAAMEANWSDEREYYHDQYLYTDRI